MKEKNLDAVNTFRCAEMHVGINDADRLFAQFDQLQETNDRSVTSASDSQERGKFQIRIEGAGIQGVLEVFIDASGEDPCLKRVEIPNADTLREQLSVTALERVDLDRWFTDLKGHDGLLSEQSAPSSESLEVHGSAIRAESLVWESERGSARVTLSTYPDTTSATDDAERLLDELSLYIAASTPYGTENSENSFAVHGYGWTWAQIPNEEPLIDISILRSESDVAVIQITGHSPQERSAIMSELQEKLN